MNNEYNLGFRNGLERAKALLTDKLEEVKNDIGGVIGYRLQLSAEEVEELFRKLEPDKLES